MTLVVSVGDVLSDADADPDITAAANNVAMILCILL
jgi:hypothetical protein